VALRRNGRDVPPWLAAAAARMADFLDGMVMADGRLPLLKDTTFDGPPPEAILAVAAIAHGEARWKRTAEAGLPATIIFGSEGAWRYEALPRNIEPRRTHLFPSSRFAVFRGLERGDSAVIDVGPVCPDALPAHAHADLFSFELCLGGRRAIVDSGVYEYAAGRWRDFFRSTRAHNTVEVEGRNQSEVWLSFRVGRRARPLFARFAEIPLGALVQSEHDGYAHLSQRPCHRRTFLWLGSAIVVIDELFGAGVVTAASRIHLSPSCSRESMAITPFGPATATWGRSWYSERFGEMLGNDVLTIEARGALPLAFGYVIDLTAGRG
jgi:hypothetical protein